MVGVDDRVVRSEVLNKGRRRNNVMQRDTIVARRFKRVKNICGEVAERN
jgi:hypothetical protein